MNAAFRLACFTLLPLALAACGKKDASDKAAGGEILPGSASDAMLPLDTVRSQPPLAPPTVAASGSKGRAAASGDAAAEASGEAGAAADGAASDAPAPVPVPPPSKAAAAPE